MASRLWPAHRSLRPQQMLSSRPSSSSGQSEVRGRRPGAQPRSPSEPEQSCEQEREAHPASAPAPLLTWSPGRAPRLARPVYERGCKHAASREHSSMLQTRRSKDKPAVCPSAWHCSGQFPASSPHSSFSTLSLNSQTQEGTHLPPAELTGITASSICPLYSSKPKAVQV